jgi:hypothetical protein
MNPRFFTLLIVVNVVVVTLGGFLAYSDLYLRKYDTRWHANTTVIDVEYAPLVYRPTYKYYDIHPGKTVVTIGSWTGDFFQLSIIIIVIADLVYILLKKRKNNELG